MSSTYAQRLQRWAINVVNYFVGGFAGGIITALGVQGVNGIIPGFIMPVSLHQFIVICLASGVVSVAQYIRTPEGRPPSLDTDNGDTAVPKV